MPESTDVPAGMPLDKALIQLTLRPDEALFLSWTIHLAKASYDLDVEASCYAMKMMDHLRRRSPSLDPGLVGRRLNRLTRAALGLPTYAGDLDDAP